MGKVKQLLLDDMMLHPESYSDDASDLMTDEELKKQMEEANDFIKKHIIIGTVKNETSGK